VTSIPIKDIEIDNARQQLELNTSSMQSGYYMMSLNKTINQTFVSHYKQDPPIE
jgi:hypothetical protein